MTIFDLQLLPAGRVELHDARRQSRRTAEIELFEIRAVPIAEAGCDPILQRGVAKRGTPTRVHSQLERSDMAHPFSRLSAPD